MSKQFYIKQLSLAWIRSLNTKTWNSRNQCLVLFHPQIVPLSGATTSGQSGPGSDVNKGVLHIHQRSSITGNSPSDCLVSLPGHSLVGDVLPFCKEAVGVFYSPSRRGGKKQNKKNTVGQSIWLRIIGCEVRLRGRRSSDSSNLTPKRL